MDGCHRSRFIGTALVVFKEDNVAVEHTAKFLYFIVEILISFVIEIL